MVNWLYVDMNSFFASCEQQDKPHLRGRPVAVVPMMANTTFCLAASYEAKKFGVKTGVRVDEARKMCPGLQFIVANHDTYVRFHHKVHTAIETCAPIHSVCSIDEFCIELTGSQKQVQVAEALAQKIKKAIYNQAGVALNCSIGLGPNILLSKLAADMQKPNGLTKILLSDLPAKLHTLKLQDIPGIGRKMESRLYAQNITTVEKLLNLNEQQMRVAWGGLIGSRYYYLLKGQHIEVKHQHTQSIGHSHVIPPTDRTFLGAQVITHKLISKAAIRLRRVQMMSRSLSVSIRYMDGNRFEESFSFHASQDTSLFLKFFNGAYQKNCLKGRPLKASVTLGNFTAEKEHQLSMFEDEKRNTLFKAVDELNNRFGKSTVYVASLHKQNEAAPTLIAFSRIPELDEL